MLKDVNIFGFSLFASPTQTDSSFQTQGNENTVWFKCFWNSQFDYQLYRKENTPKS